jgi:uncharacterized membrane protein SirB2
MPYPVYKLIHYIGIFTLLVAVTFTCVHVLRGGTKADNPQRRMLGILHGVAMFLILLGGFGMLARIGAVQGLPGWIYPKLLIWVVAGASIAIPYRRPDAARTVLILLPLLAVLAAFFALYKPF